MASIHVCDICKKEGKLVETTRYMAVKHSPELRLDFCSACAPKLENLTMVNYVKFVYKTLHDMELSDESARRILNK